MCFKHMRWLFILLFVTACGLHLGENAPPIREMTISSSQYACVGEIAKKTELYINAQMNDGEINGFVGCLQNAFKTFNLRLSGGRERDSFTADEIRKFIQDLMPQDAPRISDELLHQFMLIKQNLVGGNLQTITRADLESAIQILDQIRIEAIRMRPFIPILNPRLVEKEDVSTLGVRIAQAESAAAVSAEVFGQILSHSQKPYSFKDFETFLEEFRGFVKWEEHFKNGHSSHEWTQLIAKFKAVAVSSGDDAIQGRDWTPLFQYGTQWYLSYIKFDVGIKPQHELFERVGLQNLIGWAEELMSLVNQAVDRHPPDFLIPYRAVDELFVALKAVGWLPEKVRAESLQQAMRLFGDRILGAREVEPCDRKSSGITRWTVAKVAAEFGLWKEIQLALWEKFETDEAPFAKPPADSRLPALNSDRPSSDQPRGREAWDRFIERFKGETPLFKAGTKRIFLVSKDHPGFKNGFYNLSKMNLFRAVTDLIFSGYATPMGRSIMDWTLSQEQLQQFYDDFRDLGIDLRFVDKRNFLAGRRTFLEGKLFTYVSDGISPEHPNLTFMQTMEEAAFLYSGGDLGQELYDRLRLVCDEGGPDIYLEPKLSRDCVQGHLTSVLLESIDTMPRLTAFLNQLDVDSRLKYAQTLLNAAFSSRNLKDEPNGKDYVENSELATVAVVLHYAEAVLTRYDTDPRDEVLTENEVNNALSVFGGLALATMPKPSWWPSWIPLRGLSEHGFKFILRYGNLPQSADDFAHIVLHWKGDYDQWHLHVDRQALTQVFATLIQEIGKQSSSQHVSPTCH